MSEAAFGAHDITEAWLDLDAGGEGTPVAESPGARSIGFAGVGAERELQSSIEVSAVAVAGGRWSSFQGVG